MRLLAAFSSIAGVMFGLTHLRPGSVEGHVDAEGKALRFNHIDGEPEKAVLGSPGCDLKECIWPLAAGAGDCGVCCCSAPEGGGGGGGRETGGGGGGGGGCASSDQVGVAPFKVCSRPNAFGTAPCTGMPSPPSHIAAGGI